MSITFSVFAKKLRSVIGGTIKDFTTNLLTGGLKSRENLITELHDSTIRKYYNGNLWLTNLWADIYDVWDKQEFIRYVETYYPGDSFAKICTIFGELGFEITPDTVPERLAEIFESIMNELPKRAVEKKSKSQPKDENTAPRMLDHDREKIANIIGVLSESLQYVQNPLHDNMIVWNYMTAQEREEYEKIISDHILNITKHCRMLELIAKRYPALSELKKLCTLGKDLLEKYYNVKEREALAEYEVYLKELHDTLDQVSTKLVGY